MISRVLKAANHSGPKRTTVTFTEEALRALAQESDKQTTRKGSRKTFNDLVSDAVVKVYGDNNHCRDHDEPDDEPARASPKKRPQASDSL